MTRKETILAELKEAKLEAGCPEQVASMEIKKMSRKSISEISEELKQIQRFNFLRKKEAAIKQWFETEEGIQARKQADEVLESLASERAHLTARYLDIINNELNEVLSDIWPYQVQHMTIDSWELRNTVSNSPHYLTIEIRFKDGWWSKDNIVPTINTAALGSVKMAEKSESRTYYIVTGLLFQNSEKILEIYRQNVPGFEKEISKLEKQVDEIYKFLQDPLEYTKPF